jgi:hypothetical protein
MLPEIGAARVSLQFIFERIYGRTKKQRFKNAIEDDS